MVGYGHAPARGPAWPVTASPSRSLSSDGQLCSGGEARDRDLFFLRRVVDFNQEHEAVQLGLREGIGALLFHRILGREDEERLVELHRLAEHRDAVLLHRFEHRRLGLGGRSVDLIGEDDVGEDRPASEFEPALAARRLLQDVRARDVHRHQVRRELDAMKVQAQTLGELGDEQRLGEPRHAHQQSVSPSREAHQQLINHRGLPDDRSSKLLANALKGLVQFSDRADIAGFEFLGAVNSHGRVAPLGPEPWRLCESLGGCVGRGAPL